MKGDSPELSGVKALIATAPVTTREIRMEKLRRGTGGQSHTFGQCVAFIASPADQSAIVALF